MTKATMRTMPVVTARPIETMPGHWRAQFPEGERTYPSTQAVERAAARIGTVVRFVDDGADVFWDKAERGDGPDSCWPWALARNYRGYGFVTRDGRLRRANRVAYELAYGPIPDGMVVMHTCDNPPCVNPAHLRIGTVRDNAQDMVAKGRSARCSGMAHSQARLTDAQVTAIKALARAGVTHQRIAEHFGISRSYVGQLACGSRRNGVRAPRTTTRSNLRGQGSHSASSSSVPDTRGRSSLAGSLEAGSTVERP